MNILLTGGSGVIGQRFLEKNISKYKIIALGKSLNSFPENIRFHKNFKFYEFDLLMDKKISIIDNIESIVHLAGIVSDSKNSFEVYKKMNTYSTSKLIELGVEKNISNFIFASSVSVYGFNENSSQSEDSTLNGITDYAKSKILAEELIQNSNLKSFTIFRISSVFGGRSKSFIHKLEILLKKRLIPTPVDSSLKKSFIHIDDLVHFIELAITKKRKGIYNLSFPKPFSFDEILESICKEKEINFYTRIKITPFILKLISLLNKILFKFKLTKVEKKIDLRPLTEFILANPNKAIKDFSYTPKISLLSNWRKI